jgi:hypothetical protein
VYSIAMLAYLPPSQRRPAHTDHDADTWKHDLFNTNKLDYGDDPSSSGDAVRSSAASRDNGPRSTRLKITNLHYEVSEQELRVSSWKLRECTNCTRSVDC